MPVNYPVADRKKAYSGALEPAVSMETLTRPGLSASWIMI